MKVLTQYNYQENENSYEQLSYESQTVPDDSYTIRVLLEKFATGINLNVERPVTYISEDEATILQPIIKVDRDLTDLDTVREHRSNLEDKVKRTEEERLKKLEEKRLEDERAKMRKELEQEKSLSDDAATSKATAVAVT